MTHFSVNKTDKRDQPSSFAHLGAAWLGQVTQKSVARPRLSLPTGVVAEIRLEERSPRRPGEISALMRDGIHHSPASLAQALGVDRAAFPAEKMKSIPFLVKAISFDVGFPMPTSEPPKRFRELISPFHS